MIESRSLTAGFIRRRPQAAASAIAALARDEASACVGSLPAEEAVAVMSAMNPRIAAMIAVTLPSAQALDVLDRIPYVAAAAILRQLRQDERAPLLGGLSGRRRRDFEASLRFAPDTVGAHMTTTVDSMAATDNVGDARRLKQARHDERPEPVFVVDAEAVLVGVVPPLALLQNDEGVDLATLADKDWLAVSPHLKLDFVAALDAWRDVNVLPVVSRRRELLGAISRRRAQAGQDAPPPDDSQPSLVVDLIEAVGQVARDLFDSLDESARAGNAGGAHHGR